MIEKLKSRKFWAAFVASVVIAFGDQLGISADTAKWIAGVVSAYILGQGAVDAVAASKGGDSDE